MGPSNPMDYSIKAELCKADEWKELQSTGHEMVVEDSMYPNLSVKLKGLKPGVFYNVFMEAMPISRERFEFTEGSGWSACGAAVTESNKRISTHAWTPLIGEGWSSLNTKGIVTFNTVQFVSEEQGPANHIVLRDGHKYVVRLHVVEIADSLEVQNKCAAFVFRETEFIASCEQRDHSLQARKAAMAHKTPEPSSPS